MYRCRECNEPFDELVKCHGDRSEYWGAPGSDTYDGCPFCSSEFFDDLDDLEDEGEVEEDESDEDPLEGTF